MGNGDDNELYGDAHTLNESAKGGDDTILAGAGINNSLYGDAREMYDSSIGGNDNLTNLTGGVNSHGNRLYGDALTRLTHRPTGSRQGEAVIVYLQTQS